MFAQRLKQLRTDRQISQSELASALNISNRTISMYEKGNSEPNVEILSKIATFFGVSIDYLVGITNAKYPDNRLLSDQLNFSDETIEVLKSLSSFTYENSDITRASIFDKMVASPHFMVLLDNLCTFIARDDASWNQIYLALCSNLPDEADINVIKYRLMQLTITDEFGLLIETLLKGESSNHKKSKISLDN